MSFPKPVTLENLLTGNHLHFHHKTELRKNGQPIEVRQSGKVKVFGTKPERFVVPVKYGLYQNFKINETTAKNWEIV